MDRAAAAFRDGARAAAPLIPGIVPFALVVGVAAVDAGLSLAQTVGMSVIVFAGASQLAALELIDRGAPAIVVVATAVVINLRMLMYSASIAPHFRRFGASRKALLAYNLTDQAYALSISKYAEDGASAEAFRGRYYLGIAVVLWSVWQAGTIAGAVLGARIPARWGLEFAAPLVFLALLVPALRDRPSVAAGATAALVAVLGVDVPLNLGLLVASLVGIAVGVVSEEALA
jgi:4-azaleucine resistance transporter AzlC